MKGIILAGGSGSRLLPLTVAISKQLLPVYDKPMIYYPLSLLMKANIREILLITSPQQLPLFRRLLGDGSSWGIEIDYEVQNEPRGIAEALIIGDKFLKSSNCLLALGDNLVLLPPHLESKVFSGFSSGATIFAYNVANPQDYGVVQFDDKMNVLNVVEKPRTWISSFAIPGLYFFDSQAIQFARSITPSERMEYEIIDVLKCYLEQELLHVFLMPSGTTWMDMGTFDQLHNASSLIETLQTRQGLLIGSPDEVALQKGWISESQALANLALYPIGNSYANFLHQYIKKSHN